MKSPDEKSYYNRTVLKLFITFCYHVHFEEFLKLEDAFFTDDKEKKNNLESNLLLASQFMFSFKQFCFPVQFLVP